ncbi:MAG: ABC transporter ATP-binding protein [Flavobacteriaceae bacterium]|jgi:lipoprotein-releasing system ATP-binding protein|nr:ABC transporter ATP-binding protein [Flavobacteriaceae bacterium]MCH1385033.1 ABC transporter ATP-binding protein [Flavobacteriaceae bacterium]MDG0966719.1 ABC transporter ATP-binding protein [Flavobacteriaceae bacterium]
MIQAKALSKTYGDLHVLNGIDLEVNKKEIIAITGPSGAGKTTLLNILGTLDIADKQANSSLFINGIDIFQLTGKSLAKFRNEQLGFVFQSHQLLPEFSAIENVCIPALIKKTSLKEARRQGLELLEFLGLSDRAEHKPSMLSGGEQQRVAVARALINKPTLLLADEPSGNLDSQTAMQLHKLFLSLRDNFDQTIVLVTHNKELAALSDRPLHLVDGQWH